MNKTREVTTREGLLAMLAAVLAVAAVLSLTGCASSDFQDLRDVAPADIERTVEGIIERGDALANVKVSLADGLALYRVYQQFKAGDVQGGVTAIRDNPALNDLVSAAIVTTTNAVANGDALTISSLKVLLNSDAWAQWLPFFGDFELPADWLPTVSVDTNAVAPAPAEGKMVAAFLLDNAGTRCMNHLAKSCNRDEFEATVKRQQSAGANTIWLYTSNLKDGRPAPTSIYANGKLGGPLDEGQIAEMQDRLAWIRAQGLDVMLWLFADDSNEISHMGVDVQAAYVQEVVKRFGQYATRGYCMGIESDEHMSRERVESLIQVLDAITDAEIYVHQLPGRTSWANIPGVNGFAYQYGFGKDAGKVAAETREKRPGVGDRAFVGAEYHKSSDSQAARSLGRAILDTGAADGVGNGSF